MEISKILELADHLLGGLETEDHKIRQEISQLQREVRGLIHLCSVGHTVAAELGLTNLTPKINEVVLAIGVKSHESSSTQD